MVMLARPMASEIPPINAVNAPMAFEMTITYKKYWNDMCSEGRRSGRTAPST